MVRGILVLMILDMNDRLIGNWRTEFPAVWDRHTFEWSRRIEEAWPAIRTEVLAYVERNVVSPTTTVFGMPDASSNIPTDDAGAWRTLVLQWFGRDVEHHARHLPVTMAAVRGIAANNIGLTVLDPRAHLLPHRDPNRGAVRYQLPVIVPGVVGACRIRVGTETIPWVEGRSVLFDLFTEHEVWNDTDEQRTLLMIELPMPLPFPLAWSNRLAQWAYQWFPSYDGFAERIHRTAA